MSDPLNVHEIVKITCIYRRNFGRQLQLITCNEYWVHCRLINHVPACSTPICMFIFLCTHSKNSVAKWREHFDHVHGWVLWSSIRDIMFCFCVPLPRKFSHFLSSSCGIFNLLREQRKKKSCVKIINLHIYARRKGERRSLCC
jgi:hypothetical protein